MTRNSPTNPDVAGSPALAIENSIMNAANFGIVLATPPKSAMQMRVHAVVQHAHAQEHRGRDEAVRDHLRQAALHALRAEEEEARA